MTESKKQSLSSNQREAIEHGTGPLLIVASPGSGKTFVLTKRISYLIEELKVPPRQMLVVTFSRAAATEMKERFEKTHGQSEDVTFGTFHSAFFQVLKKAYGSNADRYIMGDPDNPKYEDMLLMTRHLLTERPDIRNLIRKRYKWILIDEFQDIDQLQYDIIRLLTDPDSNITVVGDDDQSIYGFRGARPEIMLNFENDYPGAKRVTLDINYRSVGAIVESAGNVISHNENRFDKEVKSHKTIIGEEHKYDYLYGKERVRVLEFKDVREECRYIAADIQDYISRGGSTDDVVILYRINEDKWNISRIMDECHISCQYMTFHKSKGLEFNVVYMIECNDDITPHRMTKDIEEERRSFYVAMTRAKEKLTICTSAEKSAYKKMPSRFIKELYENSKCDKLFSGIKFKTWRDIWRTMHR